MAKVLKEPKQFICDLCARSYHNVSNLKRHVRRFHIEDESETDPLKDESQSHAKVQCLICNKEFAIRSSLYRHYRKFHPGESFPSEECFICAKEFSNLASLMRHNNRCHPNAKTDSSTAPSVKIECDKCGATFRFQSTFRRHYERFHTEIIWIPQKIPECSEPLECAECGRKFSHKSNLKRHLQKLHSHTMSSEQEIKDEPHICDLCFDSFYDKSSLKRHKRTVHKDNSLTTELPEVNEFECFHCSEKFDKKDKIRKHIFRWHVPPLYHIRPMCDQCGQCFHNTSNLSRHRAKKHAHGESKSLVILKKIERAPAGVFCDICGHNFFSIRTLRQHRKRIHGLDDITVKPVNPEPVKVQCEECNKLFSTNSNLHRHKKRHHNEGKGINETVDRFLSALCIECGRSFFNKSSLKRHQHKAHPNFIDDTDLAGGDDPNRALCDECNRFFHDKSTLHRHKKKIHGVKFPIIMKTEQSEVIIKEYFCELCERYFPNSTSLMRHKVVIHSFIDPQAVKSLLRPNSYECNFCSKQFQKKLHLSVHMREKHPQNKLLQKNLLESRLCELCGQNFANKSCLLRHKRTIHRGKMNPDSSSEDEVELFECYHCNRSFRRKDSLVSHLRAKHPFSDDGSNSFECNECGKSFTRKHAIRRHLLTIHAHNEVKTANFKCTLCPSAFHLRHIAKAHYEREHGVRMATEKLRFETMDEFEEWRKEVQRKYVTMFVRSYISKTSEYTVTRYICHRSGLYRDHSKNAPRKRSLKEWGSKKIQGYCPAEIMLQARDSGCHVQFQSVHVGHEIGSRDELHHVFLDKEQKRMVAEQLIRGVPRTEIVKSLNLSPEQQESLGRLSILNFKDVDNIARSFGIRSRRRARSGGESGGPPAKRRRRSPTGEAVEAAFADALTAVEPCAEGADAVEPRSCVESYVMQNKDAFLYFKSQGEEDTVFGTLDRDDYVVVLMDQSQADNLRRYGRKVVAFDGTHTADRYQFALHTLLVTNANGEGLPVAFLVSNRRDQAVVDIFVRCVQERVGTIAPRTLISDMQTTYYTAWVAFMEPPQHYLFCSSHVNEAWRRCAAKIRSKEKRAQLLQRLVDIEQELDEVAFEQRLTAFMSSADRDLRDFLEYFGSFFYENTKHWAWCYRKFAGANTNSLINEFHHCTLRQKVAGGKRIRALSEGLRYLEAYMTLKGDEKLRKDFHGWGMLRKCDDLKKNHQLAADYCAEKVVSIVPIDERTWQIVSFQPDSSDDEIFTVDRVDEKECSAHEEVRCELVCAECNMCLHEYRCSCVESCIHSNMCKHIHVLGFYLQTHQLLELKEVEVGECADVKDLVEVRSPSALDVPGPEEIAAEECVSEENSIDLCIKEVFADEAVVYEEISETLKEEDEIAETLEEEDVKKEDSEEGHLDRVKVQILQEVQKALNTATVVPDLAEIRERFIQPLKLKLMDDVIMGS